LETTMQTTTGCW